MQEMEKNIESTLTEMKLPSQWFHTQPSSVLQT